MTYEIRWKRNDKDGRKYNETYLCNEYSFVKVGGLDAVRFQQEGHKKGTRIAIPNDYQMGKYYDSFELVIVEATTGRRVFSISK